jgi:hypothetical protein
MTDLADMRIFGNELVGNRDRPMRHQETYLNPILIGIPPPSKL